ncbi:hypothetical protein AAEU28_13570 [Pseudoalteromonas sp. SS15]|uniref:hypothetical protein n=1 Tax=Pseudoalteromonas sp. SS15 TaxID=3139393 RepID=UPI003BAC82AC
MEKVTVSNSERELQYITWHAYLALVMGLLFFSASLESFLDFQASKSLTFVYGIAKFGLSVYFIYFMYKVITTMSSIKRRNFWTASFEDEYLNHLNLLGFKWSFHSVIFALSPFLFSNISSFISESFPADSISAKTLATLVIGVMFICYALPVLYGLNKSDE